MSKNTIHDVIVVGAGPAGLTAAIFASYRNLNTLVVEGLQPGGQLTSLYPHKPVYNYPGYAQIDAGELAGIMHNQALQQNVTLFDSQAVTGLNVNRDGLIAVALENKVMVSHSVILAAGLGLLQPRKMGVPGENEFRAGFIHYRIDDLTSWENRAVAIFGGGNSAADNALLLYQAGCKVTLVHRLDQFQADEASLDKIHKTDIEVLAGYRTRNFSESADGKIHIALENGKTRESSIRTADHALINIGLKPDTGFLMASGLDMKGKQVLVDSEMRTSSPGIFACGDIVSYPGKVRLIVTAIGEAATAVNSVAVYMKKISGGR